MPNPLVWPDLPAAQQPPWPDSDELRAARDELSALPPLVFAGECDVLGTRLAEAAQGRAFVLMAWDGRDQDLWALLEPSGLSRAPAEPVRLTSGPLIFKDPFPSPDGRRVFALGEQPRTELVRFDPGSRRFVPHLGGISVRMLDYSPDGQWVAAVSVPGSALWRSRPDGTERRQLSVPGRAAFLPRWSPDGRRIAFLGWERGRPFKVQVVSAEGGEPESLFPGDRDEADPDWSPDGRALVSGFWPDDDPSRGHEIRRVDLETRMVSVVPGSRGLFSPRFSPDGRSLAALSVSSRTLGLLDLATGRWRALPAGESLAFPEWTRDGRFIDVNRGSQRIRVRLTDGQVEERASFEGLRVMSEGLGNWVGRAPDGSLLGVRDATLQEIYALELEGRW
jgi:hypothetical protein